LSPDLGEVELDLIREVDANAMVAPLSQDWIGEAGIPGKT